jgi:hypothetical protein
LNLLFTYKHRGAIEKAAEKEKSILKDPHLMEIEVEADR